MPGGHGPHDRLDSLIGPRQRAECRVHGLVMPSSGRTRVASRALRRSAAAMLRWPRACRMPMARIRNLAISLLRLAGEANIAAGLRDTAWERSRAFALLGT